MTTVTVTESENDQSNSLENDAANSAVIAAQTAIALANSQAAMAEIDAANRIEEAQQEISAITENVENQERGLSWLENQLLETKQSIASLLEALPQMIMETVERLNSREQSTPPVSPEIQPETAMMDLSETNLETSNIMPTVAPANVGEESPVQVVDQVAEAIESRLKRVRLI